MKPYLSIIIPAWNEEEQDSEYTSTSAVSSQPHLGCGVEI